MEGTGSLQTSIYNLLQGVTLESIQKKGVIYSDLILNIFAKEPPASRYLFTAKDLKKEHVIKKGETAYSMATGYDDQFMMTFDLFLGMLAERGDAFGLLFNYPRTAYITSDLYRENLSAKMERMDVTALYPGDLDQIVAHCYEETPENYFFVILKFTKFDRDAPKAYGSAKFISYWGDSYSEEDKIKNKLVKIVFGNDWVFHDDAQIVKQTETVGVSTARHFVYETGKGNKLLAVLEDMCRNWTPDRIYQTPDIYKSFVLGFIPFIEPTGDKAQTQIDAAPKIGEVTAQRLRFIFNPNADEFTKNDVWMKVRAYAPTENASTSTNTNANANGKPSPPLHLTLASYNPNLNHVSGPIESPPLRLTLASYSPRHALFSNTDQVAVVKQ